MGHKESPFGLKNTHTGCGCSGSSGVTILDIGGMEVGIRGMKDIFEDLKERGIAPDEVDKDELLEMFREYNYIPSNNEKDYKEALLSEYRKVIG